MKLFKIDIFALESIHLGTGIEDTRKNQEPENSFQIVLNGCFFKYIFPKLVKGELLVKLFKLLGYEGEAAEKVTELVSTCAARVLDMLHREQVEPGTEAAFGCYVAALHQLYLAGMAMELNALGYHMSKLTAQDIQGN